MTTPQREAILTKLAIGELTSEEADRELTALEADPFGELYMKVSQRTGAASLYGLRKLPVTFYRNEWDRILEYANEIRAFLDEHADELPYERKKAETASDPSEP